MSKLVPKPVQCDIAIIGGGLVGASLAVALAPLGLSVVVVEAVAVDSEAQPSFDERAVALTYNARQIYSGMGVWAQIAARRAEPIREIHISERGGFGMTHLHHAQVGLDALGYVVASRVIGAVLHDAMAANSSTTLLCPARVAADSAEPSPNRNRAAWRSVSVQTPKQRVELRAKLLVRASGSAAGATADNPKSSSNHDAQHAIVCTAQSASPHRGRAFERFTTEGPLALLPHSDNRYVVVWTSASANTAARLALTDLQFVAALQRAFGERAGRFLAASSRHCYPLHRHHEPTPVGFRRVTIGNAAHTVHPVAGQGFNLGLRDVAVLAEVLAQAVDAGQDLGDASVLTRYAKLRARETARVRGFTDGLIRVFTHPNPLLKFARNCGLCGIELLPPLKRTLLRRSMGLASTPTRLGAGAPLTLPK